jgi:hypothetical protein
MKISRSLVLTLLTSLACAFLIGGCSSSDNVDPMAKNPEQVRKNKKEE